MKNTDKVTMAFGQLKKLIMEATGKEHRNISNNIYGDTTRPIKPF